MAILARADFDGSTIRCVGEISVLLGNNAMRGMVVLALNKAII